MGKIIRRTLTALLIVTSLLTAAIVGATVQFFNGYGECELGEFTTLPKAKERALERAKSDAQKQAGLYLKTESRSINSELVDDVISAVTNNIIDISDVQYETITQKITERTTAVVIVAKLKASIDPSGLDGFLKRDEKEKVTIIQQNDSLQDSIQKNDKEFEDLKEQYKRATSQAEKDKIIKQMKQVDRDFLAIQKLEEGTKLYSAGNYSSAIKLYDDSIKLNPSNQIISFAYTSRASIYENLQKYEYAINDYSKSIELNPNFYVAYFGRGTVYACLKEYEKSINDFNKAIELNPNFYITYNNRGVIYMDNLNQYDKAIQDFNKAIQLNPNYATAYYNRGGFYKRLKQYDLAIQDLTRAIQINSNYVSAYYNRSVIYAISGDFNSALFDVAKSIELNPNYAQYYQLRGMIYKKLGDDAKAQADFAKAKELGYEG